MDRYQKALLAHLKESAFAARGMAVDTIYFGGGTPSFYGEKRLRALLSAIKKHYKVEKDSPRRSWGCRRRSKSCPPPAPGRRRRSP